jgi:hypothetical protein
MNVNKSVSTSMPLPMAAPAVIMAAGAAGRYFQQKKDEAEE